MHRRKIPQVYNNENRTTIVESKQKQSFIPQGILVGKLNLMLILFFL
jgi:hypothetical protein